MPVEITPLTEQDIPGAVECIQAAFATDPYYRWLFNEPEKFNKKRNVASLTARCLWGINNALFYVAKERPSESAGSKGEDAREGSSSEPAPILGVSMWMPPHPADEPESWYSYFQSWVLSARQLLNNVWFWGRGGMNVKRYWIWKDGQTAAQKKIWTDAQGYYFCNVVTVAPGTQGKGIGRKLFEIVTDQADREGRRCYLESSKAVPNIAIYGKMGFELVQEMEVDDEGEACKLFCMVREPKQKS